jgi:hypothetical protein
MAMQCGVGPQEQGPGEREAVGRLQRYRPGGAGAVVGRGRRNGRLTPLGEPADNARPPGAAFLKLPESSRRRLSLQGQWKGSSAG